LDGEKVLLGDFESKKAAKVQRGDFRQLPWTPNLTIFVEVKLLMSFGRHRKKGDQHQQIKLCVNFLLSCSFLRPLFQNSSRVSIPGNNRASLSGGDHHNGVRAIRALHVYMRWSNGHT
jgi:hypothetical protein